MKKQIVLKSILLLVVIGAVLYGANYAFDHFSWFRSLFNSNAAAASVLGKLNPGEGITIAMREELAGRVSMFIFAGISLLQFVALFVASAVLGRIRDERDTSPKTKMKQLENAEIFLDVPLYIGLFGTVSSFLVMTFSPTSSRLIAYSSTLIGIIFSLILRLSLNYPLRSKLIREQEKE
ncbi:MAG: hypothetical protein AB7F32_00410 [Victivallaceae bacterium]